MVMLVGQSGSSNYCILLLGFLSNLEYLYCLSRAHSGIYAALFIVCVSQTAS